MELTIKQTHKTDIYKQRNKQFNKYTRYYQV